MKSCLVVDDSRVIRKVACRILESLHFEATEAPDGGTALAVCREKMPDVILLDWTMPDMGGLEFMRAICAARRAANARWSCSAPSKTIPSRSTTRSLPAPPNI